MIEYTVKVYDDRTEWYLNGQRHRTDGPAIEWPDGHKYWYLNGEQLTEKELMHAEIDAIIKEFSSK